MNVIVVDDHPLVRVGLSSALKLEKNIEKIYEASNIQDTIKILTMNKIEIAIVDLRLANESGLELIRIAKNKNIETKFIVLTSSLNREDFERAKDLDVDGYLLKDAYIEDIIYAIHVVERGKKFYSQEILNINLENNFLNTLTEREKEILIEIGKGLSNIEIAQKLFISENTVKKHITNILAKLNLKHRTEAALYINNILKFGNAV